MFDLTAVNYLKAPPSLLDAVKVFLWALSANNGGNIVSCNPTAKSSAPYLDIKITDASTHSIKVDLNSFKDSLREYLKTVIEGVTQLPKLIEEVVGLVDNANTLKDTASDSLSHLSMMDKAKNLGKIGQNTAKLAKGASKLKSLLPILTEASKNLQEIIKNFTETTGKADEIGKKAIAKKTFAMDEIMQNFHPADKHTEKEIKQLKVAAEKKRKEEEEEKKKKDNMLLQFLEAKKKLMEKK